MRSVRGLMITVPGARVLHHTYINVAYGMGSPVRAWDNSESMEFLAENLERSPSNAKTTRTGESSVSRKAISAAAINSNVTDMSKWLMMLANDGVYKGKKILDSRQLWEMESPQTLENFSREWGAVLPSRHFEAYGMGLEMYDYHGFKVLHHGGGADGMISLTAFVPEKKLGMVILTNSINYLPTALMYYILDDLAGNPETDWNAKYLQWINAMNDNKKADDLELEKHRNKNSSPSLDLAEYTGTYGGEMYGNATVSLENDKLIVRFIPTPIFVGDLSHFQYDTFKIKLRNSPSLPGGTVNFVINAEGKVESMRIDIPNPDFDFTELEFKKLN